MAYDLIWKADEALPKPQPVAVCAREPLPDRTRKSIFLAGPTPRDQNTPSWRPEALRILDKLGYDGYVFIPEDRSGTFSGDYTAQVEWETAALNVADIIVFWVPRDMKTMPALTTNVEFGIWMDSGKVVLGAPDSAVKNTYLKWWASNLKVPFSNSLETTLQAAIDAIGDGASRWGGEAQVPLHIWKHPTFQGWLRAQKGAGNRLDGAKVLWSFRVGPERKKTFAWALHVNVYVASEDRNKTNEFVFGRVDIASVVLYHRDDTHMDKETDVDVILVREFRSPARTSDGFIVELPAGSIEKLDPKSAALKELEEETGVKLDPNRLRLVGTKQVAGTLSAHTSVVYAAAIEYEEYEEILRTMGKVRGVAEDTERTTITVDRLDHLLSGANGTEVDWATLGMISAAVLTHSD